MWTFTMDSDGHLTIYRARQEVFSGSYEAFVADGDVVPPAGLVDQIHARYERLNGAPQCPDCGEPGEIKGHMACQYPKD